MLPSWVRSRPYLEILRLERSAENKRSSLMSPIVSYEEKSVVNKAQVASLLHYLV
jgi:hypothetical protein